MSSKIKFELNSVGVKSILKSSEARSLCAQKASEIVSRCGAGYGADTYVGSSRVNAMVFADSAKAQKDNSENNTLLKAVR